MKRIIVQLFVIFIFVANSSAKIVKDYACMTNDDTSFVIDSIDFREDLTRIYGCIIGLPHSSNKINEVMLLINNDALTANDIDGVDFHRYFQWENEERIDLEVDFPPIKPASDLQILFITAHGNLITTAKTPNKTQ